MSSDELPPPGGNTDGGVTPPPAGSLVVNPEGPRAYILEDRNDDHSIQVLMTLRARSGKR